MPPSGAGPDCPGSLSEKYGKPTLNSRSRSLVPNCKRADKYKPKPENKPDKYKYKPENRFETKTRSEKARKLDYFY